MLQCSHILSYSICVSTKKRRTDRLQSSIYAPIKIATILPLRSRKQKCLSVQNRLGKLFLLISIKSTPLPSSYLYYSTMFAIGQYIIVVFLGIYTFFSIGKAYF